MNMHKIYRLLLSGFLLVWLMMMSGCSPVPSLAPSASASDGSDQGMTRVHFINVGQGDCELIESDGRYMLIDAGEQDEKDSVIRYLEELGVKKLDYVIGTHPHSDHIGGLAAVIEAFEVDKVILPPKEHTTGTFERLLDAIAAKGLKITKPVAGSVYELGGASFTVIAPNNDYEDNLNNWSVGIRLDYGSNSFVLTGDAEAAAEADICSNGISLQADVLKLGHHGSSTSNSMEFLEKVNPDYAVISCGRNNSYGHPHREVMQDMEKLGIQIFRTDQMGTIIAASDGNEITFQTEVIWSDSKMEQGTRFPDKSGVEEHLDQDYVLNTNTRKIHKPDCSSVAHIKEANLETYIGDLENLLQQGYTPCQSCKP